MPYKDKEKAKQYYHERYLRRKQDPNYRKKHHAEWHKNNKPIYRKEYDE